MARSFNRYLCTYNNGDTEKVYAQTIFDALNLLEGNPDE